MSSNASSVLPTIPEQNEGTLIITEICKFCTDISHMYSDQTFTDITLVVESQKIKAHKIILATRSKFFASVLRSDPNQSELKISNAPINAFQAVLKFFYTGSITVDSSDGNLIFDIIKLAARYSLQDLEEALKKRLTLQLPRQSSGILGPLVRKWRSMKKLNNPQSSNPVTPTGTPPVRRSQSMRKLDSSRPVPNLKARVTTGINTAWLLSENEDSLKSAYHPFGDKNGITVDLGTTRLFNTIKMKLKEANGKEFLVFGYCIETSLDQKKWTKILNYSEYDCRSYQNLYFEKQQARFVRVVGKYSFPKQEFSLVNLKIDYKENVPQVINGIVRPEENVATAKMGAYVWGLNSNFENYPRLSKNGKTIYKKIFTVHLGQPYLISSMRLRLNSIESYTCTAYVGLESYMGRIYMSMYDTPSGSDVVQNAKGTGDQWEHYTFDAKPINYITFIIYTEHPPIKSDNYFECPSPIDSE